MDTTGVRIPEVVVPQLELPDFGKHLLLVVLGTEGRTQLPHVAASVCQGYTDRDAVTSCPLHPAGHDTSTFVHVVDHIAPEPMSTREADAVLRQCWNPCHTVIVATTASRLPPRLRVNTDMIITFAPPLPTERVGELKACWDVEPPAWEGVWCKTSRKASTTPTRWRGGALLVASR